MRRRRHSVRGRPGRDVGDRGAGVRRDSAHPSRSRLDRDVRDRSRERQARRPVGCAVARARRPRRHARPLHERPSARAEPARARRRRSRGIDAGGGDSLGDDGAAGGADRDRRDVAGPGATPPPAAAGRRRPRRRGDARAGASLVRVPAALRQTHRGDAAARPGERLRGAARGAGRGGDHAADDRDRPAEELGPRRRGARPARPLCVAGAHQPERRRDVLRPAARSRPRRSRARRRPRCRDRSADGGRDRGARPAGRADACASIAPRRSPTR